MRRLGSFLLFLVLPVAVQGQGRSVRIGVLGIFHPHELTLAADRGGELVVSAERQLLFLSPRAACELLVIQASGSHLRLNCGGKEILASEVQASGRNRQSAGLVLAVPGKIRRRYDGILDLKSENGELIPIVTMDLETAVASAVQAETAPGTPMEALKAQAVVSRSYFVAGAGRHSDFDFCDLTHCQVVREPPSSDSPAARATAATRNLVLNYDDKPFAAMFTPSCGGHTRTPAEVGLPQNGYPYFSVLCDYCHRNPSRWTRAVSREDAMLLLLGENGRLQVGRRLGWNAVPSNNFVAQEENGQVILRGAGRGHGLGLCERGARDMAERGSDFAAILAHYFPNTKLQEAVSEQ
jgi:stage II sporulation protein D (peptidoglycan lytic transglycosylase)